MPPRAHGAQGGSLSQEGGSVFKRQAFNHLSHQRPFEALTYSVVALTHFVSSDLRKYFCRRAVGGSGGVVNCFLTVLLLVCCW